MARYLVERTFPNMEKFIKSYRILALVVCASLALLLALQPFQSASAATPAATACRLAAVHGSYEFVAPATIQLSQGTVIAIPDELIAASPAAFANKGTLLFTGDGHIILTAYEDANRPLATSVDYIGGYVILTVSDLQRSVDFYSSLLGFQKVADLPNRVLMSNGSVILGVGTPPNPDQAVARDTFNENRIGLDHVSMSVSSRRGLEQAVQLFDQNKVPHGEIKGMPPFGIAVLAFRDPDNIQVELTSPIH